MSPDNALLQPFVLGSLSLPNRVVMAPLTRNFSPGNLPGDTVVEHYRRRAAGGTGLIITEGSVGLDVDFIPEPGDSTFREANPASLDALPQRLQAGEFDLVVVGRALIANPDWVELVRSNALPKMKAFRKENLATLA